MVKKGTTKKKKTAKTISELIDCKPKRRTSTPAPSGKDEEESPPPVEEKKEEAAPKPPPGFSCAMCGLSFKSNKDLIDHKMKPHFHRCTQCDMRFCLLEELTAHRDPH